MKWMEAQKIADYITTDDWHGIDESYDHAENGQNFVIDYNHKMKTVTVYYGNDESAIYHWRGTKDHMTREFRDWLHYFINSQV